MSTYNDILANFQALGFSSSSITAIFKKQAEAIAIPIDNTLTEIANSEAIINKAISDQRYGKSGYYTEAALAFQTGDDLVIDPVTLDEVYLIIDPTKQIVKQAAFSDFEGSLALKIAASNGTDLIALTTEQLNAFISYFTAYEIPGLPLNIISENANVLNFNSVATYYATYDLTALKVNIELWLNNFKQSFEFNGIFFSGDLQDYLKSNVPGLRDFFISGTTVDGNTFSGSISLDSGYFNYISTILDQITYVAI